MPDYTPNGIRHDCIRVRGRDGFDGYYSSGIASNAIFEGYGLRLTSMPIKDTRREM
jgi:hypothetical protein